MPSEKPYTYAILPYCVANVQQKNYIAKYFIVFNIFLWVF